MIIQELDKADRAVGLHADEVNSGNVSVTQKIKASGNAALFDATLKAMETAPDRSIIFTNFVDFDMLYGHRRDVEGYAEALEYFDERLPELLAKMSTGASVAVEGKLVASQGGAPEHPVWYHNLKAEPNVEIRDATVVHPMRVREVVDADERQRLWAIAVEAFPPYQEYQEKTERDIPVFVAEPR